MGVFRKSDPANNLILELESDPKSKLCRKFYRKKIVKRYIFNNF